MTTLLRMSPSVLGVIAGGYLLLHFGANALVIMSYRPNDPGAAGVWPAVLAGIAGWLGLWWLFFRHIGRNGIGVLRATAEVAAMLAAAGVAVVGITWALR